MNKKKVEVLLNLSWLYETQVYTELFMNITNVNFTLREQIIIIAMSGYNSYLQFNY